MVRLRVNFTHVFQHIGRLFQFQDGAIKSRRRQFMRDIVIVFQFQDGAIKRATNFLNSSRDNTFQFQDGAIKSNRLL